jgi:putative phosphonate catabolism associated alcohol dehydrogenase
MSSTFSRALVFHGVPSRSETQDSQEGLLSHWTLEHRPVPVPDHDEILVRNLACTICASDVHTMTGRRQSPTPTVLGHEIVGFIEAFGDGANTIDIAGQPLKVGDRVVWSVMSHCGTCSMCQRGVPQKCLNGIKYGHHRFDDSQPASGGLSDHCLLKVGTSLMRLPDEISNQVGCLLSCSTATAQAAVTACQVNQGSRVAIIGAGMLGLNACAICKESGAQFVAVVEPNENRREMAYRFGADSVLGPCEIDTIKETSTDGIGFDSVIECSGKNDGYHTGMRSLRVGGKLVLLGAVFPSEPVSIVLETIVRQMVSLVGIHNYGPSDFRKGVEFLRRAVGRYPFEELLGPWFPLDDWETAIPIAAQGCSWRVGFDLSKSHKAIRYSAIP